MFTRDLGFVHRYFVAEKQESLLFLVVGIAAIGLSVFFYFFTKSNPSFYKGAAIPLLVVGLIQGVVGYTVYARSDSQRMDVAYQMGLEPVNFLKQQELPRMKTVMKNFAYYRYTELILAIAGIGLFFFFRQKPESSFWIGLGLTLAIQAIIMLGADYFAEKRGGEYTRQLEQILASSTPQ
jgi:hypothetical protein